MKAAVVYYSMSGNTQFAAEKIAEKLGADLIRLVPKTSYPAAGFKKFLIGGRDALKAAEPELEAYAFDAEKYDLIIFGMPVWASSVTPPLRTFIRDHLTEIGDKKIAAFSCMLGSGGDKALAKLQGVLGIGAFAAAMTLIEPKSKNRAENEAKIDAFCKELEASE